MWGVTVNFEECFEQSVPAYLGIHDRFFLLFSVLGMSVESAPPAGEEKEEDTGDDITTHSLGAEGSFMPFSG